VAYQYIGDQVYQVGEFVCDGVDATVVTGIRLQRKLLYLRV
jgi:hypothetical protein